MYILPGVRCGVALLFLVTASTVQAGERPIGQGMTEANKERLTIGDMEDVSGWSTGSPAETTLSRDDRHVKQGRHSLKFGNVVDHTKGEKNYPIGWPRTAKELAKAKLSDWSGWDFFECWVYVETSRAALPAKALGVNFYHSGVKRSTSVPLKDLQKDAWTRVVVPLADVADLHDIQRVQFSFSESDYKHGDRVDFFIDDVVLTRYAYPAVAELNLERRLLFTGEQALAATFRLVGSKGLDEALVELEIIPANGQPAARGQAKAARRGEVTASLGRSLPPGTYAARLNLRDGQKRLLDVKSAEFRVIAGPF